MFYFTRTTKTGDKLITAYKTESMATQIAAKETTSTDCGFWEGEMYIDPKTGKRGPNVNGLKLLSHMESALGVGNSGPFALFSESESGGLNDTGLRFETYGTANSFMKNAIGTYGKLWVAEIAGKTKKPTTNFTTLDEAPF